MPIIKKIIQVGNARAIIIPKGWISYWEEELNCKLIEVGLEINKELIIRPYQRKLLGGSGGR